MKAFVFAAIFALSASLAFAQAPAWSYAGKTGPVNWGKLDPAYAACAKGHEQAPIDIRGARLNKSLQPLEFHFLAGGLTLVNDGRTIRAEVHPGSYLVESGLRYELTGFSFHNPGEGAVRGKFSDMDVQLHFRSAEGKLAIVAVRFNQDQDIPNALLALLWEHLPHSAGKNEKVTEMVNPGGFLPSDRGYWTYMGSLSEPPCTEGVRWFVFEQEIPISRAQYKAFVALYKMNARPLQETRGRRIEANQ